MKKNNFVPAPVTLGADVADAGTFTVAYPAGYNAGDFSGATGHYLSLNGDKLQQPQHITLSFGAASVTVTNGTGGTLAAGSKGYFQFEMRGQNVDVAAEAPNRGVKTVRASELFGLFIDFGSPKTLDADGLFDGVSVGATAATFTVADMKAATANGGVLDVARALTLVGTSGADHVATINGFDEYDQPMSESITANGATPVAGKKAFKRVVTMDIAAGGAASKTLDVGWGDVLGLPVRINTAADVIQELEAGVPVNKYTQGLVDIPFQIDVADLSTGSAAAFEWVAPYDCVLVSVRSNIRVAISTGGTITGDVRGGTAVDGLTITVANSATKGTSQTDAPTAAHASTILAKGDRLQIIPQDAFTGGGAIDLMLTVRPTGLASGALVAGLAKNTKATATTADVRGTYTPATACDGTTSFALKVAVAEVQDIGNYQYAA